MGSIDDKISYLTETKTLIKEAIVSKGVEINNDEPFRNYANKINQISSVGKSTSEGGEIFNDYKNNKAFGINSHAEGTSTIANNYAQSSKGQYNTKESLASPNIYNKDKTILSIGNGTSDTNRSDAVKILGNGTTWISGVGDFTGKNPTINNSLQAVLNNMIWMGNQQEYNAIATKNPKTLYLIQK